MIANIAAVFCHLQRIVLLRREFSFFVAVYHRVNPQRQVRGSTSWQATLAYRVAAPFIESPSDDRRLAPQWNKPLFKTSMHFYFNIRKCLACRYSGFTFSHYDLPFPTRYRIPYVRSGLYQLFIRVKGFRVYALHYVRVITSITHCIRFCPSAWTPRFQWVEFCIASAGLLYRWLFQIKSRPICLFFLIGSCMFCCFEESI